ncbi:MAG: hypothetical protein EXQ56_04480 [Acidobacteria bacterium]|nr:hypothetical protein [Acidobacteriota bacterium]
MTTELPLLPILRDEIRAAGGAITFARFMELCLYHPQLGYYNSERVKLGRQGDFYTNMHMGPVFARILARHFESVWDALGKPVRFDLVELGPGDGQFARELLPWIARRFPDFASALHYLAVEQSSRLRESLQQSLETTGARFRVEPNLPEVAAVTGCIFTHEFFDALPVHILVWRNGRWMERCVGLNGDAPAWCEREPSAPELAREAEKRFDPEIPLNGRVDGWQAEVSPASGAWVGRLERALVRGEMLVVDYGYTLDEWRLGRFREGSAMGYREHRAVVDLLGSPGDQDLTAHVNFDLFLETLAKKADGRNAAEVCLRTQSRFLMAVGESDQFADVLSDCADDKERQQRARQLKSLILPEGMGSTFQVLQLRKRM